MNSFSKTAGAILASALIIAAGWFGLSEWSITRQTEALKRQFAATRLQCSLAQSQNPTVNPWTVPLAELHQRIEQNQSRLPSFARRAQTALCLATIDNFLKASDRIGKDDRDFQSSLKSQGL